MTAVVPVPRRPIVWLVAIAWLVAVPPAGGQTGAPALADLLSRLGAYVGRFQTAFSNVVSEERYVQRVTPRGRLSVGARPRTRELVSDFLLVRLPEANDWVPFRDVFQVDGAPVRDHQDRLLQLFTKPLFMATQRAGEITEESARYNIGIVRTVNQPLLALHVAQASEQDRFAFSGLKADPSAGAGVFTVAFQERSRPTVVRGPGDSDMPMHGRLWVDASTGTLLRTEVIVEGGGVQATIVTRFQYDARFDTTVPIEMSEEYIQPDGTQMTGTATYGRFRQFQVDVKYGRRPEPE